MESFTEFVCNETMMCTIASVMKNLNIMRQKSNRMCFSDVLKYFASISEPFCVNGPQKYRYTDSEEHKANVRLNAHYLALGGIICRITKDDAKSEAELRNIVNTKMEDLKYAIRIIESVCTKCPAWFSDMPLLVLHWMLLFVVEAELSMLHDCLPDYSEEAVQDLLMKRDEEGVSKDMEDFKTFYEFMFNMFYFRITKNWIGRVPRISAVDAELPRRLRSCYSHICNFLEQSEGIFAYSVFRNNALLEQVEKAWEADISISSTGSSSLTVQESGVQIFHEPDSFIYHLTSLLKINGKTAHGITTALAVSEHLSRENISGALRSHGGKRENHSYARCVALQIDICNIWRTLREEAKHIIEFITRKYSLLPLEETQNYSLRRAKSTDISDIIRKDFKKLTMALLLVSVLVQKEGTLYSNLASQFL